MTPMRANLVEPLELQRIRLKTIGADGEERRSPVGQKDFCDTRIFVIIVASMKRILVIAAISFAVLVGAAAALSHHLQKAKVCATSNC
jgi:hypothetical protein